MQLGVLPRGIVSTMSQTTVKYDGIIGPFTSTASEMLNLKTINLSSLGETLKINIEELAGCALIHYLNFADCPHVSGIHMDTRVG